jgi:hypothetical protein
MRPNVYSTYGDSIVQRILLTLAVLGSVALSAAFAEAGLFHHHRCGRRHGGCGGGGCYTSAGYYESGKPTQGPVQGPVQGPMKGSTSVPPPPPPM